jgi:hypothetical protein
MLTAGMAVTVTTAGVVDMATMDGTDGRVLLERPARQAEETPCF